MLVVGGDQERTEAEYRALFDAEIVARMGPEFYREVFVPVIREARAHGRSYQAIRDAIRRLAPNLSRAQLSPRPAGRSGRSVAVGQSMVSASW